MAKIDLPEGATVQARLELSRAELADARRRAAADEFAPSHDEQAVLRYLVYLGASYIESGRLVQQAESRQAAFDALYSRFGGIGSGLSVLRFHYGQAARNFAAEQRARAAQESIVRTYEGVVQRIEAEIALREERVRNLEEALPS